MSMNSASTIVEHFFGARVFAVDLVDDEDDRQILLERLAQHEAGLRHRPLGRVDEQQHAVDHLEHAFDLAAEIRVAGRVDDVDLLVAPEHAGVLGEDGDAALALDGVGVHHELARLRGVAEHAGLAQHRIDQGRLAVVDVSDDRDVTDVGTSAHISLYGRYPQEAWFIVARATTYAAGGASSRHERRPPT